MDEAFNAGLEFNECTVIGDVRDATMEARFKRIFRFNALPRIIQELLHAQRDAMRVVVDLDDLHAHRLADVEHLGRMVDTTPCNVGDMQQAVDAAQIHERTVIGDVLDHTFNDLTFFKVGHDFMTLFSAALFENRTTRDNDIATTTIHLEDLERLRHAHERGDVADRTNVDLRTGQEGDSAVEIDSEATLDLIEDDAVDLLAGFESLFELDPAFFAARLVARNDSFTERVFNALQVDFDNVADLRGSIAAANTSEFTDRHATFGLQTDVDDENIFFDTDNGSLNNGTLESFVFTVACVEKRSEIIARRVEARISGSSHNVS